MTTRPVHPLVATVAVRPSVATNRPRRFSLDSLALQLVVVEGAVFSALLYGLWILNRWSPAARSGIELIVTVALALFSISGLATGLAAVRRVRRPEAPSDAARPAVSAVIPAYLPNEESILLGTIDAHLATAPDRYQLVVAYNTPRPMAIEAELARRAALDERLLVLAVQGSTSKSENMNAALDVATGAIIGVFDADHHPEAGAFDKAWCWIAAGYDAVQGRCVVRAGERASRTGSMLASVVAAEFETMYAVGHPGRRRLHGIGFFAGSNGYWNADSLRTIRFDPSALTEDIDASVRVLIGGGKIAADPGIVSSEMAPPTLGALSGQRLRWAQGWFQVSKRYLTRLVLDQKLTVRQRIGAFWLFGVTVGLPWLATVSLPLVALHALSGAAATQSGAVVRYLVMLGSASFLAHTVVAYIRSRGRARGIADFLAYVVASMVFYSQLRVSLVRLGQLYELAGRSEWRITRRA